MLPEWHSADFALALHRLLIAPGDVKNFAWSPYSVASALGLVTAGARGTTYDELIAALRSTDVSALATQLAEAARLGETEVAVANSLWMQQGMSFEESYQQQVLIWPGGALHRADFRGDPEGAREKINADVEQTTRKLIRNLIPDGAIHPQTVAVLVNALYLKVAWRLPFDERGTESRPFHAPGGIRQVPTMRQQERLGYAEAHGWRMATLSTEADVAVDVLLPPGDRDLADALLTPEDLEELRSASSTAKLDLTLPRFRVEGSAVLNSPLKRLGARMAFTRDADFSGITRQERIWIDQVVHKAVLRADEKGFEGAAATAIMMRAVSLDVSPVVPFHVDRPFLVIVRHEQTGAVYFLARVTEP